MGNGAKVAHFALSVLDPEAGPLVALGPMMMTLPERLMLFARCCCGGCCVNGGGARIRGDMLRSFPFMCNACKEALAASVLMAGDVGACPANRC